MLGNRGSVPASLLGGYLQILFFFNLVEKNSLTKTFLSAAKMASTVYETDNCLATFGGEGRYFPKLTEYLFQIGALNGSKPPEKQLFSYRI